MKSCEYYDENGNCKLSETACDCQDEENDVKIPEELLDAEWLIGELTKTEEKS